MSRSFHEVAFFYKIDHFDETIPFVASTYFKGYEFEDERYIWFPLADLARLALYPKPLKELLTNKEQGPFHFIANTLSEKE